MAPEFKGKDPGVDGSFSLQIEGTKIVCHGHDHDCAVLSAGFRVMLLEVRKRDARIKELKEEILKQEVNGMFKGAN